MSMNVELRQVPVSLLPALERESRVFDLVCEAKGGLDLGKSWAGLSFLLSGDAHGNSAAFDGVALDLHDTGYGPPMILTAEEVKGYARELSELDDDSVSANFSATKLSQDDVYPRSWSDGDREWLLENLRKLRAYYVDAAARSHAMLVYLI